MKSVNFYIQLLYLYLLINTDVQFNIVKKSKYKNNPEADPEASI